MAAPDAAADLSEAEPELPPLAPVGVQIPAEQLRSLVEQLRTRLAGKVEPAESTLWGADILDGSDPRSTHILAKFVRSRDLNLDNAEKMVLNTIAWRRSYGTDRIIDDHSIPDCLSRVAYLAGRARTGHSVLYFEYGPLGNQEAWDAAFNSGNVADGPLIRSRIKLLETGIREFEMGKGFDEPTAFVLVHDLRDAPLAGVLLSTEASHGMIQMVKIANDFYPDMSIRHVFLNAPTLMSTVLTALKPFLSSRTQKKLIWAPKGGELVTLLSLIPIHQIPSKFGGFLGVPNPPPETGAVQEVEVLAGRTESVTLRNMAPGDSARWVVSLAERDIMVKVEFIALGSTSRDKPTLLEEQEIVIGDSTVEGNGTYNGTHVAKEAGNIRITFDNGVSWMTAKHVFYSAGVISDRDGGASALAASAQEAD